MAQAAGSTPSLADFNQLAQTHTLIPVFRTLTADLETPVSAFLRLAQQTPQAFLFESVEGGEHVARWTFMGIDPYKTVSARAGEVTLTENGHTSSIAADIFELLKEALTRHTPARLPGLPPFTAGAVGFFAYDVVRLIEQLPSTAPDELHVPDACLMFFDQVVALDNVRNEMILISTADLSRGHTHASAVARLDALEALLARPLPPEAYPTPREIPLGPLALAPRTPRADFLAAVETVREYIAAGDVFQCVLSQRFDCQPQVPAFDIYRALRVINPSPYMFYLRFPLDGRPAHIVGASPELLVRVNSGTVEYRPIAGTRKRSADEAEDRLLEADLRADEKEVAEHIMLVDLGRNDVGRVSAFGSVRVKNLMFVERYSHVMHLVSSIEGTLKPGLHPIDAFKACFPAGTLSGAPKIRAMQIIEELEPTRRGVYGGSIFYADFSGNLDSCIAIRTLYLHGEPGHEQGHIQAGAGIVADSVPESEYEECRNKAQAVVRAIERAREG